MSSDVISLVRHAIQEYGSPYAVVDHENLSVFEKKALGSMLMKEVAFRIGYGAEDTKGKDLCIVNNYEDPSSASVIDYASQVFHVSDTDFITLEKSLSLIRITPFGEEKSVVNRTPL